MKFVDVFAGFIFLMNIQSRPIIGLHYWIAGLVPSQWWRFSGCWGY